MIEKTMRIKVHFMTLAALLSGIAAHAAQQEADSWLSLVPGMELRWILINNHPPAGDSRILVVRIDPVMWKLEYVGLGTTMDSTIKTAREWAKAHGLTAAINAGMFNTDYRTPVGYVEFKGRIVSKKINRYQSIATFDPRDPHNGPFFRIFDLDSDGVTIESIRREFTSLVQNLRLVKRPRENRWGQQDKIWSEAALGEDKDGNILFVFCRFPFSMHDLNRELLSAEIGLVALQHLEGGPQAQLFLNAGKVELEMFGSHGTSFSDEEETATRWPIPNVLGIKRRVDK